MKHNWNIFKDTFYDFAALLLIRMPIRYMVYREWLFPGVFWNSASPYLGASNRALCSAV